MKHESAQTADIEVSQTKGKTAAPASPPIATPRKKVSFALPTSPTLSASSSPLKRKEREPSSTHSSHGNSSSSLHEPGQPATKRASLGSRGSANNVADHHWEEYCRDWVRNGLCRYPRRCQYKHEMPSKSETLHMVTGWDGVPIWWQRRQAQERINDVTNHIERHG